MSYPRLVIFLLLTIGCSLLQMWVVIILQAWLHHEIKFVEIFSDGSLFFFSTTLVFGSWFSLLVSDKPETQTSHSASFAISMLCVGLVTLPSIVMYSSAENQTLRQDVAVEQSQHVAAGALAPPAAAPSTLKTDVYYFGAQLACASLAVIYTFFVGVYLGFFSKPKPASQATARPAVTERV